MSFERSRSATREVVKVPDTFDAWAVRVLTIAIIICIISAWSAFAAAWTLNAQVEQLQSDVDVNAKNRMAFQYIQVDRACVLLRALSVSQEQLKETACLLP